MAGSTEQLLIAATLVLGPAVYLLGYALGRAKRRALEAASPDRLYSELLNAVERKYPNESRHETALRHIRTRERQLHPGAQGPSPPIDPLWKPNRVHTPPSIGDDD